MPLSRSTRPALLLAVGVILLLNHAWLFPMADESRYTLERKAIDVENGELTYYGVRETLWHGQYSGLNALDCQGLTPIAGRVPSMRISSSRGQSHSAPRRCFTTVRSMPSSTAGSSVD